MALSHLGFLIQMYISHLDDLSQLNELQQLKQQKDLVESMHRNARERVAATHPTAPAIHAATEAPQEKRVNFRAENSSDLPKCHLDLSFLRDDGHQGHSPSSPSSPSPSASAATVFRLKILRDSTDEVAALREEELNTRWLVRLVPWVTWCGNSKVRAGCLLQGLGGWGRELVTWNTPLEHTFQEKLISLSKMRNLKTQCEGLCLSSSRGLGHSDMSPFAACCRRTFFVDVDLGCWQSASHNSIVVVLIDPEPHSRDFQFANRLKMSTAM